MYRIVRLKQCLLLGVSILFFSCSAVHESNPPISGSDKDKHGCIPSSGYVWSELKKECVRSFELEIQLVEVSNNQSSYTRKLGILFSEDQQKCEVFLSAKPLLLNRKDKDQFAGNFGDDEFNLLKVSDKWNFVINDTLRFIELTK